MLQPAQHSNMLRRAGAVSQRLAIRTSILNHSRACSSQAATAQQVTYTSVAPEGATDEKITTDDDKSTRPSEIVKQLDRYIVGQQDAKRAVAVAMRNRWRRQRVASPLKEDIMPKNILMIGPTGVGKTEVARRLAKLARAPFLKVEATKFTEVGFVGKDVDQIVRDLCAEGSDPQAHATAAHSTKAGQEGGRPRARAGPPHHRSFALTRLFDLPLRVAARSVHLGCFGAVYVIGVVVRRMDVGMTMAKARALEVIKEKVSAQVEETLLDCLVGPSNIQHNREAFRKLLRMGHLDDRLIEIEVPEKKGGSSPDFGGNGVRALSRTCARHAPKASRTAVADGGERERLDASRLVSWSLLRILFSPPVPSLPVSYAEVFP